MKSRMQAIGLAAALGAAALSWASPPANAAGCIKGAILGGVAGHYVGNHGLLGAGAGCLIGRHYSTRQEMRQQQSQTATRQSGTAVTRNQYGNVTARNQNVTPVFARDRNGNLVSRNRYDTTGYGSSIPDRMR